MFDKKTKVAKTPQTPSNSNFTASEWNSEVNEKFNLVSNYVDNPSSVLTPIPTSPSIEDDKPVVLKTIDIMNTIDNNDMWVIDLPNCSYQLITNNDGSTFNFLTTLAVKSLKRIKKDTSFDIKQIFLDNKGIYGKILLKDFMIEFEKNGAWDNVVSLPKIKVESNDFFYEGSSKSFGEIISYDEILNVVTNKEKSYVLYLEDGFYKILSLGSGGELGYSVDFKVDTKEYNNTMLIDEYGIMKFTTTYHPTYDYQTYDYTGIHLIGDYVANTYSEKYYTFINNRSITMSELFHTSSSDQESKIYITPQFISLTGYQGDDAQYLSNGIQFKRTLNDGTIHNEFRLTSLYNDLVLEMDYYGVTQTTIRPGTIELGTLSINYGYQGIKNDTYLDHTNYTRGHYVQKGYVDDLFSTVYKFPRKLVRTQTTNLSIAGNSSKRILDDVVIDTSSPYFDSTSFTLEGTTNKVIKEKDDDYKELAIAVTLAHTGNMNATKLEVQLWRNTPTPTLVRLGNQLDFNDADTRGNTSQILTFKAGLDDPYVTNGYYIILRNLTGTGLTYSKVDILITVAKDKLLGV